MLQRIKNREKVKRHRKKVQRFVRQLKHNKRCKACRKRYPHYVFHFDHVRGKKLFNISRVSSTFVGRKRLLAELKKCELVCANCHARRTWKRANS